MNRFGIVGAAGGLLAAGGLALACASVLGVEDGVLDPLVGEAGAPDTSVDGPGPPLRDTGGPDVPVVLVDSGPDCAKETADDVRGIFVSAAGLTSANCGSKLQPCATLALGLTRAKAVPGVTTLYVDSGTYAETLDLTGAGGLLVQGGWDDVGGTWRRQCTGTRTQSVKIVGQGGVGVRASSTTGQVTLDTLSIEVGLTGVNGSQSLYGVLATGATTWVRLADVAITVGNAGSGGSGAPGGGGADGANCNGTGGADGAGGTSAGPAGGGSFGSAGYSAPSGGNGTTGGGPGAGTGGGGAPAPVTCISACALADGGAACEQSTMPRSGANGSPGCGGEGGGPGGGAAPGGSAFAVYAWDSQVNLVRGAAAAGNAGAGGSGGRGGAGGLGVAGAPGADANMCNTVCALNLGACVASASVTPKGGAGGPPGGHGGVGGAGGGASGGYSYAVFTNANAVVTIDGTTLTHGTPGAGGGGAPSGKSGDMGSPP